MHLFKTMSICATVALCAPVQAATVTSIGAGSAVSSADLVATFASISTFAHSDLSNYSEGGLSVTVPDDNCCYNGVFYGESGNNSYVTIAALDGRAFVGVEFDLGSGYFSRNLNVVWQALLNGIVVGSGQISGVYGVEGAGRGARVLGWFDAGGMDELRVGADISPGYDTLGEFQAIAIDNVRVELAAAQVPLPATLPLMLAGFGGLMALRRRRGRGCASGA